MIYKVFLNVEFVAQAQMYKEVASVISELIKKNFHKIPMVKHFLLNVVLKSLDNISYHAALSEQVLLELINTFLQVDNLSSFTKYV